MVSFGKKLQSSSRTWVGTFFPPVLSFAQKTAAEQISFMPASVLVLGGLSGVGRHVVYQLTEMLPPSVHIRVVDRSLPALSFLSDEHKKAIERCEFMQANLAAHSSFVIFYIFVLHPTSRRYGEGVYAGKRP